jgi:hypothetical protein
VFEFQDAVSEQMRPVQIDMQQEQQQEQQQQQCQENSNVAKAAVSAR